MAADSTTTVLSGNTKAGNCPRGLILK